VSITEGAPSAVRRDEAQADAQAPRSWIPRGALHRVMLGLAVLGLAVAAYLTYVHYSGAKPACSAGQSCLKVQTSQWSRLAGVPVALIGLVGYVTILASLLLPDREETRLGTLGLTLIGFGFSAYLTYRELFSIHAVCEWCASSAVILTLLLGCSIARYLRGEVQRPEIDSSLLDE
jgi:uncharacterized membrane protein